MYSNSQVCANLPSSVFNNNYPANYYFNNNPIGFYPDNLGFNTPSYHVSSLDRNNIANVNTPMSSNLNYIQYTQPPPGYPSTPTQELPYPPYNDRTHQLYSDLPSFQGYPVFTQLPIHVHKSFSNRKNYFHNAREAYGNRFIKSEKFHCGACDKDFFNEFSYEKHVSEHLVCKLDGCTFSAHPKVIEKHISMQHRNGLFNRIMKGNSPEEIEKWIAERKKQYPTSARIADKQAQKEEMEKRGERYKEVKGRFSKFRKNSRGPINNFQQDKQNKYFGNDRRFGHKYRQKVSAESRNEGNIENPYKPRSSKQRTEVPNDDDDDCITRNLPPFLGIDFYKNCETTTNSEQPLSVEDFTLFSDEEWSISNVNITNSLSSIDSEKQETKENLFSSENIVDSHVPCSNQLLQEKTDDAVQPCISVKAINSLDLIRGYDSFEDSEEEITEATLSSQCNFLGFSDQNNKEGSSYEKLSKISTLKLSVSKSEGNTYKLPLPYFITKNDSDPEESSSKVPITEMKSTVCSRTIGQDKHNCEDNCSEEFAYKKSVPKTIAENFRDWKETIFKLPDSEFITRDVCEPEEYLSKLPVAGIKLTESVQSNPQDMDELNGVIRESKRQARKRKRQVRAEHADEKKTNLEEEMKQSRVPFQKRRYRPPSLLEKLLASEIKHERNVILQCVRHVVNNYYFGIGQQKS